MEITVKHHMSAGHRIPGLAGEGSKCSNIHGHTFGISWTFRVDSVNAEAIEFAEVKKRLRGWINEHLDHGFICYAEDIKTIKFLYANKHKLYVVDHPPTTEMIATEIANAVLSMEGLGEYLVAVDVTEGPHNSARWSRELS